MDKNYIDKFVIDLYHDKNFLPRLSDLLSKLGVVILTDTNSDTAEMGVSVHSPTFPSGVDVKLIVKKVK
jgi:hypothetical protein